MKTLRQTIKDYLQRKPDIQGYELTRPLKVYDSNQHGFYVNYKGGRVDLNDFMQYGSVWCPSIPDTDFESIIQTTFCCSHGFMGMSYFEHYEIVTDLETAYLIRVWY